MKTNTIHTGDCIDVLDTLQARSVHMCMTSPPYWNLRDYDHDEQLGLEDTAEEYVDNIATVMDSVKRVLREDGSLWLNLGDTYHNKDLQLIPERVALELQNRGWILRNKVTWAKPNPMPQSVKDRLNDTTEKIFHFVKDKEYWYDLDAIREAHAESSMQRAKHGNGGSGSDSAHYGHNESYGVNAEADSREELYHPAGKNPGDVFEVTTKPFPDAHFAVYPPELCEKPIKATCPPKVCVDCGAPYEREVERESELEPGRNTQGLGPKTGGGEFDNGGEGGSTLHHVTRHNHIGWNQTCACDADVTLSGICLDPFAGAGTTLLKAKELGRRFMGIELNPEYADMARGRVGLTPNDPSTLRDDDHQQGLGSF